MHEIKNSSKGHKWSDVREEFFTQEEISESNLRVALIGKITSARQTKGYTQKS